MTRDRAVALTATLNTLLVLLVPLGWLALRFWQDGLPDDNSTIVRAPGAAWRQVADLVRVGGLLLPFAFLAFWRSVVYARRVIDGTSTGWRGVGEAVAVALGVELVMASPALVSGHAAALPFLYVQVLVAATGVMVGLILRTAGLVTLRLSGVRTPPAPPSAAAPAPTRA